MKKLIILFAALIISVSLVGQAPANFKYQAVLRDVHGMVKANVSANIGIDILKNSNSGTAVYSEYHQVTTDTFGLVNLEIGNGIPTRNKISDVDWGNGTYFIKITVDGAVMGTGQFLSVPYALNAKTAEKLTGGITEADPIFVGWNKSSGISIVASQVSDFQASVTNNAAVLANSAKISYPAADAAKLAAISGTNTGDETATTIKTKLGINSLSGTNTGDQDLSGLATTATTTAGLNLKVDKVTGKGLSTNDYTTAEQKKLAAITGTNTGDQDITAMTHSNRGALDAVTGVNTGDQDLSGLATTSATTTVLNLKVDKVTGKGLSTNDYTTAEQSRLAVISGTNTGDETATTIKTKLGITTLSGSNTGDQDLAAMTHSNRGALDAVTGVNTGDQVLSGLATTSATTTALNLKVDKVTGKGLSTNDFTTTEQTKLAAITGTNTGDQDIAAMSHSNRSALDLVSGTNTGDQNISAMAHTNRSALDAVSGTNTGDQTLPTLSSLNGVPATRSINGHALSADVTVTASDVNLGNADNTSDTNKPVSTAQQTALDLKASATSVTAGLALKIDETKIAAVNGVASLDATGKIPSGQIPTISFSSTYVVANQTAMLAIPSALRGDVAIRTDLSKNYVLSATPGSVLGNWIELLTPAAPVQSVNGQTGTVNITKSDVLLGNAQNTSDLDKPVSTLQQAALDLKENTANKSTTTSLGTSDVLFPTQKAVKTYVDSRFSFATSINKLEITAPANSATLTIADGKTLTVSNNATVSGTNTGDQDIAAMTHTNRSALDMVSGTNTGDQTLPTLTDLNGVPVTRKVNGHALSADVTVSAADVNLGNVDNTSDANKPVSSAQQAALDLKASATSVTAGLALKIDETKIAAVNGVASLDAAGKIPAGQIPAISFSNTFIVANQASMLAIPGALKGDVAIRTDNSKNFVLGATPATSLDNWIELLTPAPPVQSVNGQTGTVNITKSDVLLGNAQNTSDLDKPVSTLQQTALNLKVDKVSGKGLSTNDYTTAEQTKLAAITGTNTGDQDIAAMTHSNRSAIDAVSGTNTGDQVLPTLSTLGAVAVNPAITAATKTKVTYDAKGLVTAGADATTADIAASTDKNYITDAKLAVLNNTTGINTGDQDLSALATTTAIATSLNLKVDKVTGKGLSTNDYTTAEQTKLAAISGTNTGDQTLPTLSSLGAVAANTAITGATKTKLTYDAKGLVTAGADATTADIAASTNKNYVTDAQLTAIGNAGNTSGTNTGDNAVNSLYSGLTTNATHTGDVTGSAALTIADKAVTMAKMADMETSTVIYRKAASTGAPEVQTLATLKSDLGLTGSNTGDQTLPTLSSLGAVAANTAITAGSNTKITYDAKGLVTAGAAATTADIAASTDKNYVTDAEKTAIIHTNKSSLDLVSGTNTGDNAINSLYSGLSNYTHPTGDGNLHVPATSTTNSGKVLTAGAEAGSLSWSNLSSSQWTTTGSDIYYNTGNVGIGTTTPGLRTEIYGVDAPPAASGTSQTGILRLSQSGGKAVLDLGNNGSVGSWLQSTRSDNLSIYDPLLLNPNGGKVGIGTSTPASKFQVYGTETGLNWAGRGVFGGASYAVVLGQYNDKAFLGAHNAALDTWADLLINQGGGNVGIGTMAPTSKLHISGFDPGATLLLENTSTNFGRNYIMFNAQSANQGYIGLGSSGANNMYLTTYGATNSINLATNNSDRLVILANGYVGIGTTTPNSTLDITGPSGSAANIENATTNSFQIETGKTAGDQILYMGNDKTNHVSYMQSVNYSIGVAPLLLNARGGNVGIGTMAPTATLDVHGASGTTLKVVDGNQAAGKVLTSDASGNASWQTVGSGTSNYIQLKMSADQSSLSSGSTVAFNTTFKSNGMTSTSNGIDLKAGVTYRLEASLSYAEGTTLNYLGYTIVNSSNSVIATAYVSSTASTSNYAFSPAAIAIYTPAANETVYLKIGDQSAGTAKIRADLSTYFIATEMTSSGGSAVSLASGVTGTLPVASGGTGATTLTGYVSGNGTGAMTAATTIPGSAIDGYLPVEHGGTGTTTGPTQGGVIYAVSNVVYGSIGAGTSGQALLSGGTGAPTWSSNISGNAANVTGTVAVANGGTGTTNGSITGTSALAFAAGGTNQNVTLTPSGTGFTLLNGNVGIGTTTPLSKLDVRGLASASGLALNMNFDGTTWRQATTGYGAYLQVDNSTGNFYFWNTPTSVDAGGATTTPGQRLTITSSGNVGIGTTTPDAPLTIATSGGVGLKINGGGDIALTPQVSGGNAILYNDSGNLQVNASAGIGAYCTGTTWVSGSDSRLKRDIQPMNNYGLNTVMQLKPVTYYFKADKTNHPEVGFIAQDMQKIIPEVVSGTEGDLAKGETLGLSYGNLVPVLTKAIQEQQSTIQKQQTAIEAQQMQIDELKRLVEGLMKK